jgi:Sulfotransferase family
VSPRLPDFLLLGAPKCGTSALHAALARHPGLYLSEPKEPKFFLTDGPPPASGGEPGDVETWREHVWRRPDYENLFAAAPPGARCGESTVFYLYDLAAQRRIRALLPAARLIAVLRDPVDRAHSNWAHLHGARLEPEADFLAALNREPERIAAGWAPFWRYTALGRYGRQLEHLFGLFPPEQVLLLRYRELRDAPAETAGSGRAGTSPTGAADPGPSPAGCRPRSSGRAWSAGVRRPAAAHLRLRAAAQFRQVSAAGRASRRASGISDPQFPQRP